MAHSLNPKVYALTFTTFVMLSSEFIVAGLLPEIASALQITVGNAGWLVTAFALGMGVGAPLIAAFTHRVSLRLLLITACVALFLGNTICALTDNFALLMIGRALGGVGVAIFWTNAVLAAAAMSKPEAKSLAVSRVLIGASIASVVGVPLGKAVSDAWRWEDALLLMAVLSALALAMVIRWIHVPERDGSQLQSTLSERLRAVCRPDIVRALLSYLLIFGGIMAVFSYLATFLVRYTHFPFAYVTPVLALYGVADIVGNLVVSRHIPDPLEGMFKRLLIVLAISLTALSLFGTTVWMIPFVIAAVGCCHAAAGLMTGIDVLRRAGANAQLVGAFNVSAINVGIMLGSVAGGLLIDHIGLAFIGCLGGGFVLLALLVRARLTPA
ncbi:MFS transporter [Pseudomonas syringae]|uniref:MFS transporter n=1 Tax=Pseudomonas syringae TaxID=317 RepID=UPI002009DCBB|nr:MFS transporter [Pseudomonas syringae]MCK9706393.1 MFS transporter [Pseudomonas syringae pv. syringae]